MKLTTLFSSDQLPERHSRSAAALVSVFIHSSAAGLLAGSLGVTGPHVDTARHHWVELSEFHLAPPPKSLRLYYPRLSARSVRPRRISAVEARQTLVVPDALREVQLQRSIPLPLALPSLQLERSTELSQASAGRQGIGEIVPPSANVLSIPDENRAIAGNVLIPKVNQSGGDSTGSQGTQGNESEHQISAQESRPSGISRIDLPPNGTFPVSVFGPSTSDQYPDVSSSLTGKIVSTVYLNVGAGPKWSLEFWAPGPAPEAPWAYEIYRPDPLSTPPDCDVILLGGKINANGSFEGLEVLMPTSWPESSRLLESLSRWKFRPARRQGSPVSVDVLLVIPSRQPEQ